MSATISPAEAKTFCVNHPQTETYMRCNKCGKPVCIKCVQRTPVGYRCHECLGLQRQGYYTATALDYISAAVIGLVLGVVGGFVMSLVRFWLVAIFAGPIAGGIIAETIRWATRKRRGRHIGLTASIAVVVGGIVVLFLPIVPFLLLGSVTALFRIGPALLLNIGFWIYLALAVSTTYARLRA